MNTELKTMAAILARMVANIGKLARMAADEMERPTLARNASLESRESYALRMADRKAYRASIVKSLRALDAQFSNEKTSTS